ncbi:MAG: UDP-N-acetylmuramoyl-L-alanyl-D-glutamate--2,6-diaminopimelate ligase [Clostridiales bacterium]|nr:UDP-N-acetylmuramoyl-L-alanyl-D-glutamate--2,6-diaminopimelate ligase [Clostridiales bacterium]
MKLADILQNIQYSVIGGDLSTEIKHIAIDSRFVRKNTLFICIKGLKTDGHKFIEDAAAAGAAAILTEGELPGPGHLADAGTSVPPARRGSLRSPVMLRTADTRRAAAICAANFYGRPSENFRLIGVTGTNGKTSTTYFLEEILCTVGHKVGVIGTVDTRIGREHVNVAFATSTTPDPLELQQILAAMRDAQADDVVMEVTSHALALSKVEGIGFELGVFTNLTQDHLDFHGTMENYREAKARFFKMCQTGVFNADDEASEYFIKNSGCSALLYGIDNENKRGLDVAASNVEFFAQGVKFDVRTKQGDIERVSVPIPGRFTVYNALAAICAAQAKGISMSAVKTALGRMAGVPGRIQSVPNDLGISVIVDYAHTPDSLENILKSVREFTAGRLITVFGCGGDRDRTKRAVMGAIAGRYSDYCVITSDNPRTEDPVSIIEEIEPGVSETGCAYEKLPERKAAIEQAICLARRGDSVVIAGKGHENYQIFKECTVHFDDSEEALDTLSRKREA